MQTIPCLKEVPSDTINTPFTFVYGSVRCTTARQERSELERASRSLYLPRSLVAAAVWHLPPFDRARRVEVIVLNNSVAMAPLEEALLERVRAGMRGLKAPGHYDKVFKEECMYSFDTPFSPGGLYVNLKTFQVLKALRVGSKGRC